MQEEKNWRTRGLGHHNNTLSPTTIWSINKMNVGQFSGPIKGWFINRVYSQNNGGLLSSTMKWEDNKKQHQSITGIKKQYDFCIIKWLPSLFCVSVSFFLLYPHACLYSFSSLSVFLFPSAHPFAVFCSLWLYLIAECVGIWCLTQGTIYVVIMTTFEYMSGQSNMPIRSQFR